MCNPTDIAINKKTAVNHTSDSKDKNMPMGGEDKPKGPFSEYASERVLSRLDGFQQSVDSSYRESLPQDKLAASEPELAAHAAAIGWNDVSIENVLGEGGFSFIFKVKLENSQKDNQKRDFALKCLKAKAISSEDDLEFNAKDLYTESYLLSRLNHQHIVGIHGVMDGSLADSYLTDGYFILLDIMEATLFDALVVWRESATKASKTKAAVAVRVQNVAYPVVEAMQYLHQHDIVLRDLKPENIGFDRNGQVKLFDFGLARHISVIENGDVAGSICYMAPEVMLKESINHSCDIYSFAIVLWELCTLQVPLEEFEDIAEVERRVARGNWRPSTTWIPSKTLRALLKDCWNRDPKMRPDFVSIEKTLRKSCNKEGDGVVAEARLSSKLAGLTRAGSKADMAAASFSEIYNDVLRKRPRRGRQSAPY